MCRCRGRGSDLPPTDRIPGRPAFAPSIFLLSSGGDHPSPFADLRGLYAPPEDETYSNSDIDTRKLAITPIKDETGAEMRRIDVTLPVLAEHIRFRTAAGKMQLPWLKLAIFGNKRSEKNSLRTNENTLRISGVEVEQDAGEIAFGTALATILKAGIRCIIYTSPSYVPDVNERWRILLPLSQNREPEVRESSSRASTACLAAGSRRKASCCRRRICTAASIVIPTIALR